MTPEDRVRVRVRVDALDAAVRTSPFDDGSPRSVEQQGQADALLLTRAAAFERWLLEPVNARAMAAPTTSPRPPDVGVVQKA